MIEGSSRELARLCFFFFFDMFTQEGKVGFELVTSASWGVVPSQIANELPLGDLLAGYVVLMNCELGKIYTLRKLERPS